MREVEPKVFVVAETSIDYNGLVGYLNHIDAFDWVADAPSDPEELIELMGRSCYKSFGTDLNPNLTKVREGNADYIRNIVNVKHGSVLEHASVSFMFCDVSRVFTHELVRHRAGVAISQESLRFVRLTDLGFWAPTVVREDPEVMELATQAVEADEALQKKLADIMIDDGIPFSKKKVITSAMRRFAPIGLATNIGWTANFRALRWVLQQRTHPSAEEEIRKVFAEVGHIATTRWPNVFGDFSGTEVDGHVHWAPEAEKV